MSASKFASITSSLLARKGEAKPWEDPDKKGLAWRSDANIHIAARPPEPVFTAIGRAPDLLNLVTSEPPRPPEPRPSPQRRISLRMTAAEYEQLGIMGVKKNKSRQLLLQEALHRLLAEMAQEYRSGCACLERSDEGGRACSSLNG